MTVPSVNWNYPTAIKAGPGRVKELPEWCRELGMTRPLLVTDPGLASLPMVANAVQACNQAGLACAVFHEIKGNPTGRNVEDGVVAYQQGGHDGVIAFGGGSALDAAKAIALMVGQDRPLWDFEDIGDNYQRVNVAGMAPVVAVPTTAGTGSEVGRASVITDEAAEVKRIIFHARMLPAIVILDAELTLGLPPRITAATGMDALSHNLEAYCSPFFHPMAAGIAIEGMRMIKEYLPQVVADGSNVQARQQMLVASTMGATAFQRGLGAMHALAHPLGALYDAHHGMLNAILMPYVLKANQHAVAPRLEALARYLDLPDTGPGAVLDWVLRLREAVGIPHTLADIGIDEGQVERVGRMASVDPSGAANPVNFTADDYSQLLRASIRGNL
ncbi:MULTISPECIES: iron-containing alcohol dehydrogenase [Achromobacter]|uniref:Iron-containing alcohol dehydrogenase n=1 Tax=Achromobacter spanius TaxID=217203 RepID=A0ABY8GP56_9BURK|nr:MULTISPECIES: iron-containing alcohol dehydrogenase [Achromobacter]WAI84212.1 iron-containing alcohol dehydrogenase [Achromobacter spanius]WEX94296.1 iron-containing alcohol dehydrogenase [Achromobacter sp. SS2-2022]WFP06542.1 iron-containing alcohol dehydrogenase [Achromobacter spanius]